MVPELLFRPSLAKVQQMGVSEAVGDAISAASLHEFPDCQDMQHACTSLMLENVQLIGGNCAFRGFREKMFVGRG